MLDLSSQQSRWKRDNYLSLLSIFALEPLTVPSQSCLFNLPSKDGTFKKAFILKRTAKIQGFNAA